MVTTKSLRRVAQVLALWTGLAATASAQAPPADGTAAPDFASVTTDGRTVRLADFAGKVVVLDFWATWCAPCIGSMPHLQEVAAAHRDELVVLAVCTSDGRDKFDAWVKDHAGTYPDLRFTCDPNDRDSDTFEDRASQKLYHVAGLPTKFVIGKDGKIALGILGVEKDDQRLEAGLARAGLAIDAAVAAAGEAQAKTVAERLAREAAERARRPVPAFFPGLMGLQHGDPLPPCTLLDADGKQFGLDKFAGKPVIVAITPASGAPKQLLQEIALRYQPLGVTTLAVMTMTSTTDYGAWVGKNRGKFAFVTGGDPAGVWTGDAADQDGRMAFHKTTVLGKWFGGGMYPAMPAFFVLDGKGAVMGSFLRGDKMWDGIGNLLLRAGVSLPLADMPKEVAGDEAFARKAARPAEAPVTLLAVGSKAPDFPCQDLDGKTVKLGDFAGKVVVLDFWATWCGPCKAALPHVQQVAKEYAAQGVVVLASCTNDGRADFESFVRLHGPEYPDVRFVHDAKERGQDRASRALYGVSGIPQQFVIGRDGTVAASVDGYLEGEVLLDAALAKAGIQVDAAILERAAADLEKRKARSKAIQPALPLLPAGKR